MSNSKNSASSQEVNAWREWAKKQTGINSDLATNLVQSSWSNIAGHSPVNRSPYVSCNSCRRIRY